MSDIDPRMQWWIDHVHHTREYVNGVFNKKPQQAVGAIRGLWSGVLEWRKITGLDLAPPLMGEHTIVAKIFTDSAARGFKPGERDYLVGYFLNNKDSQADLYGSALMDFPKEEFKKLFTDHIVYTGAYITDASKGDMKAFHADFQKVLENMHAMANFSLRAFTNYPAVEGLDDEEIGDEDEEMSDNDLVPDGDEAVGEFGDGDRDDEE